MNTLGVFQAQAGYSAFLEALRQDYVPDRIKDGVFGAMMDIALVNDGPVTYVALTLAKQPCIRWRGGSYIRFTITAITTSCMQVGHRL